MDSPQGPINRIDAATHAGRHRPGIRARGIAAFEHLTVPEVQFLDAVFQPLLQGVRSLGGGEQFGGEIGEKYVAENRQVAAPVPPGPAGLEKGDLTGPGDEVRARLVLRPASATG